MSRLGETIRAARLKKGLTPKALGKKCGVAESFINDVEMGTRIVSDDQAQRILKVLGVENPISTELEVAAEPEVELRPRPRPYVIPVKKPEEPAYTEAEREATQASADAWLDALGGVMKRVPIMDETGVVIEHRLLPVIGGRIEGGQPDKVFYYRCPDDSMRGFRMQAGDLLLTIPQPTPVDDSIMIIEQKGVRMARKIKRLEGNRVMLQSFDREFKSQTVGNHDIAFIGKCVRMEVTL